MTHGARFSIRARIGGLTATAAAVLVLAACGSSSPAKVTSTQAVDTAFSGLSSQSGVNVKIGLSGVTGAQVQQIAAGGDSGSTLDSQAASSLAQTSINIDFNAGHGENIDSKQAAKDSADQFDFGLQVGTDTPLEIRYLNGTIYLHADISTLSTDFGQSSSEAAKFESELQSINSYVPGITALGQNQWVSAQTSAFAPLLQQLKTADPSAANSVNPAQSKQLLNQLSAAVKANSTYVDAGTQGGRTDYKVTVQAHNFVQQLQTSLNSTLASIPGTSDITKSLSSANSQIPPGQTFVFDLWVKDNRAQEVDVDLNQFKHKYSFAIPLQIQFGSGAGVDVPTGATALDLSKISSLLGSLLGGGLGST